MSDTLRLARILSASLAGPRVDLFDPVTLKFRALPSDCDANLHINNGRYLQLMDLGRFALVARLGLGRAMMKHKWGAVVGSVEMEFLKEIRLMSAFSLSTRIVGWDQKWVYMEQRFEREGKLAAVGRVQGVFRARNRTVPTAEVLAELGPWHSSPQLPSSFERIAAPSPLRKRIWSLSENDLPGLGWAA
jgi:acyl-CoA thioesterase FadM